MEDIINEELLEDGTKKISIYSGYNHELIKYYHVNDKGQKHGIEFDPKGDIETTILWENGEMVGKPIRYKVTPDGEKLRIVDHLSELEDNQTHKVLLSDDFHELKGTPLEKVLTNADNNEFFFGTRCLFTEPIEVTMKDNQLQHAKIVHTSYPETRRYIYIAHQTYDMEFKDGKEYNGTCIYDSTYTGKTETLYKCTEGKCSIFDGTLTKVRINLSEELKNSPQSVSMSDEARASLTVLKVLQGNCYSSSKRSCNITPDNIEKLPTIVVVPRDGAFSYQHEILKYNFETKDGKLDGEFSYYERDILRKKAHYKNNMLNGPYQEFFENGSQVKISGSYKDDKKHGIWKYYDHEGKVIKTELWKDGVDETAKYAIMRKVSAKHAEHREPVTKVGKAIQKTIKSIEVGRELKKLQEQKAQKRG